MARCPSPSSPPRAFPAPVITRPLRTHDTDSTDSRVNQLDRSIMNSANDEPNSKGGRGKTSPDHGLKSAVGSCNDEVEPRGVFGYEQQMPRVGVNYRRCTAGRKIQ